jgi:hypothetical protein
MQSVRTGRREVRSSDQAEGVLSLEREYRYELGFTSVSLSRMFGPGVYPGTGGGSYVRGLRTNFYLVGKRLRWSVLF